MLRDAFGDAFYFLIFFGSFIVIAYFFTHAIHTWIAYNRKKKFIETEKVLLEIRVPREIHKTPHAMELVLGGLFEPGGGDWYTDLTSGDSRPVYSFEMASFGGEVRFYIWSIKKAKPKIEAHFYAQYPEVEILEVPDYTKQVPFSMDTYKMMGFEWGLSDKDPVPIRTYKTAGYELKGDDPAVKEDPITQTIEVMAAIGPQEHMWSQIVARAHKGTRKEKVNWTKRIKAFFAIFKIKSTGKSVENFLIFWNGVEITDWKKEAESMIKDFQEKHAESKAELIPKGEKIKIEAIQENVSKTAFDCGLRTLYFAPVDHFDGAFVSVMGSMYKQYGSGNIYNSPKPALVPVLGKPWQDISGKKVHKIKEDLFKHYRRRTFFYDPVIDYGWGKEALKTFTLSVEELATIYHLPGDVVQTPTFERVESTTGQAPANLPL